MSSYPDFDKKLEIADIPESQEEKEKPSTSTSTMSGDRPKRAGRKPGRRSSKMDASAKLERSRQSARECRARKKMRYQYLEDLVANREKAVFALRNELEMCKQWCIQVDKGLLPLMLLKICEEDIIKEAEEKAKQNGTHTSKFHQTGDVTVKLLEQLGTNLALNGEEVNGLDLVKSKEFNKKERKEPASGATGGPGDLIGSSTVNLDDIISVLIAGENTDLTRAEETQIKVDNSRIPSLFCHSSKEKDDTTDFSETDLISVQRTKLPTILEEPE